MAIAGVLGALHGDDSRHLEASVRGMGGVGEFQAWHDAGNRFAMLTSGASVIHARDGVAAAFDGSLFQKDELARTIGLSAPADLRSCASLLIAAYGRWGENFARHLDGEFTFVLFDSLRKLLFGGRDAMGRGSLHYSRAGSRLLLATEPTGLFAWPDVSQAPDDEQIARTMTLQMQPGRTMFKGVFYPPPGRLLMAEADKAERLERYWFPERQPQLRPADQREYAGKLREAMLRAVQIRLPAQGSVGAELSGGYDSSAVTAIAAAALQIQNRSLTAFTSVPRHDVDASMIVNHGLSNEWPLASRVAGMHPNIEHVPVSTDAAPWAESLDAMTRVLGAPPLFIRNMPWMYAARRMAQKLGIAVMLSGQNGNLAGSYDGGFALFDMLRRRQWMRLAHTGLEWHRKGAGWASLVMRTWMPTAGARLRLRRWRGSTAGTPFAAHSLLRPDFVRSTGVPLPHDSVIGSPVEGDRTNGASRRFSIMQMLDFGVQYAAERRIFGVNRSDPTADRQLIELCLAIPDEVFCPYGKRRGLYREAMQGILPPELLQETGFGVQASDFLENFATAMLFWREQVATFERSDVVGRYLDLPRMQEMLESFPARYAADRAQADLLYNYTFGGAVTLGRFLCQMEAGNF